MCKYPSKSRHAPAFLLILTSFFAIIVPFFGHFSYFYGATTVWEAVAKYFLTDNVMIRLIYCNGPEITHNQLAIYVIWY